MSIDHIKPARRRREAWLAAALSVNDRTPAGRLACGQGFVLTHPQARAVGLTTADVRRLVARKEWTAPRRGVLCVLPPAHEPYQDSPHGLRPEIMASAVALPRPDTVISHECAALARGLDVLRMPDLATLTTRWRMNATARHDLVVRAAGIEDDDIEQWFGARITGCARTVVDLARQGIAHGLVAADSALYNELLTLADIEAALERATRWHGVVGARRLLELASPLSESPLESCVRLFMANRNIPLPRQQAWIETDRGWYRVDGCWDDERVIIEADGLVKYRWDPNRDPEQDPFIEEKLRQEALERAGFWVVRVLWADLRQNPDRTEFRIRSALRRRAA